jgi:hypothetical protein
MLKSQVDFVIITSKKCNIIVDMKGPKPLPKKITSKMTTQETKKYEKLQKEWIKTGDDMVKAQAKSVEYGRTIDTLKEPTAAQKKKDKSLIDAGFRAEEKAFKKADEYDAYKDAMKKKYE